MKRKQIYFIIVIALIIFIILFLMLSPFLNIQTIEINGLKRVEKTEIMKIVDLENKDKNLLAFNKINAIHNLKKNYYIKNVEIKKVYPNKIIFNINEREIAGYVPYVNNYLYIDKEGFIVDIQSDFKEKLPIIKGLKFYNFILGKYLQAENKDVFNVVMRFTNALEGKEIAGDILEINVSDINDIHLYIQNVDVYLGNSEDINAKINILIEVMKNISPEQKGFLYIQDINTEPVFRLLT